MDDEFFRKWEWQNFILDFPEFRFESPDGDDRENRIWPKLTAWRNERLRRAEMEGFEQQAREFQEKAEAEVRVVAAQLMVFEQELSRRQAALDTSRADVEKERAGIEAARGELKSQLDQLNTAKTVLGGIDPAVLSQLTPRAENESLAAYRLRTGKTGKEEDTND